MFDQEHDQCDRYIVSTGGGVSDDDGVLYPGVALFRRGLEVHAVVATQTDVWNLGAVGQTGNASWHSLGLTWHRQDGLRVSGLLHTALNLGEIILKSWWGELLLINLTKLIRCCPLCILFSTVQHKDLDFIQPPPLQRSMSTFFTTSELLY